MSNVTLLSFPLPNSHGYTGSIKLRFYYTGCIGNGLTFLDSGSAPVACGQVGADIGFYKEVDVTVASNTLTIPDVLLVATDNATPPTIRLTAVFFVNGSRKHTLFSDYVLTNTLGSTINFGQLFSFQPSTPTQPLPNQYLTATQVAGLIVASTPVDADVGTKGITELSAAPVGEPIAVGDNDPRLPTFRSSAYASLAAAVTAIGATPGRLLITAASFPSGATTTVPATLVLDPGDVGTLLLTTGHVVTILSSPSRWPIRKLFFNALSGQGTVALTNSRYAVEVFADWWGAVSDGSTNSQTAIQAATQAVFTAGGGTVKLLNGVYIVDGTLDPTYNSLLKIPANGSSTPVFVRLQGGFVNRTSVATPPTKGTVVQAAATVGSGTYPAIIAAKAFGSTAGGDFNYVIPVLEDINFRTSNNPTLTAIQFHNCIGANIRNVMVDNGTAYNSVSEPTNANAAALIMPGVNNNTESHVENFSAYGYFEGVRASEHVRFIGRVSVAKMHTGLNIEAGYRPVTGNVIIESCPFGIFFSGESTVDLYVSYERYDSGSDWWLGVAGQDISEASSGLANGSIRYKLTIANVGDTPKNLSVTLAPQQLDLVNVYKGNYHLGPLVIDSSIPSAYMQTSNSAGVATMRNMSPQVISGDSHYTVNAFWDGSAWQRNDVSLPSWDFYISTVLNEVAVRHTAAGSGAITWTTSRWKLDSNATAGETPLLLFDISAGTLKRVSIGAADSGGAGFKVLRIPN